MCAMYECCRCQVPGRVVSPQSEERSSSSGRTWRCCARCCRSETTTRWWRQRRTSPGRWQRTGIWFTVLILAWSASWCITCHNKQCLQVAVWQVTAKKQHISPNQPWKPSQQFMLLSSVSILILIIIAIIILIIVKCCYRGRALARVHSVHFDECRLSAKRPPTLRPSQPTWAVSLPLGCYQLHSLWPLILVTRPQADTHSTVLQRVDGWVDLGGWLYTKIVYLPIDPSSNPSSY